MAVENRKFHRMPKRIGPAEDIKPSVIARGGNHMVRGHKICLAPVVNDKCRAGEAIEPDLKNTADDISGDLGRQRAHCRTQNEQADDPFHGLPHSCPRQRFL
jgi:hypothetical protein